MLKGSKGKVSSKIQQGFTIIEVIIVLVIAAIIMLAVFLVVPQLQRTQRNSRAQTIARQVLTAAEQFAANNNGTYPTCAAAATMACTDITNTTDTLKSPAGTTYATVIAAPTTNNQISITKDVTGCATTSTIPSYTASTGGKFMVVVYQETSTVGATGAGTTFCLQN
jgi:prepilin-type N-terminal cleavage/methylation domain-containing protein